MHALFVATFGYRLQDATDINFMEERNAMQNATERFVLFGDIVKFVFVHCRL